MKFTDSHEWIHLDGELAAVGISKHAQKELGEIVYIQLPEVGREVTAGVEIVVVESTKAASDIYSPISGTIVEVNTAAADNPNLVNEHPETQGWLFKLAPKDRSELDSLLDARQYLELIS